jgi:predicted CXXCH cytochrome family protein
MKALLDRETLHAPIAEGRCTSCHEPHGSAQGSLLKSAGSTLCKSCHPEVESWSNRPVRHPPFAKGECVSCHETHASDYPRLAKKEGAELCASCHNLNAALRNAHKGYPVDRADCLECHDPHASERAGLFRESLHPPFEVGDCAACHASAGSGQPFRIRQPMDELCGACHGEQVQTAKEDPFPHVPAAGGDCTVCHNPHTADGAALLRDAPRDLCLSCHNPGGAKSGREGRYLTHAEEVECTTCHAPHAGERPLLFQAGTVEVCGGCHSPEHNIAHPMGEGSRDPRNGAPMTCRSCHGIHDAPFPKYMHRSGDRDLCLTCHQRFVEAVGGGK